MLMGDLSLELQSAACRCCQHSYSSRPRKQRWCSYTQGRPCKTRKAAAASGGSYLYRHHRICQVHLERWRQLRCNAAEQPPPPPPPGRNPASSQRMRNLGFGQEQNGDAKGQRQRQEQGQSQAGSPEDGEPGFRPPWNFSGNQKRSTSKPGSPKERSSFLRGGPDNGDELASAISQAQLLGGDDAWDDWAAVSDEADWDDPQAMRLHTDSYKERRRKAWEAREAKEDGTPRDSFLRPMVDLQGAKARLGFNAGRAAEEIEEEFDENRWESQEALKYAAFLVGVPLLLGYTLSRLLADPFFEVVLAYDPNAFALSDKTKVEGAKEVHRHEMRLRMDAALGRAPPLTEQTLQLELRREAKSLERKFKERNRQALLNVLSDGTSGSLIFAILLQKTEGRAHLFRTLARLASGLSDTAKAFLIIAGTDILLGYHSEEGWTAALRLLSEHYGMEAEDKPIYIFVAIVPVVMDAIFKYWIFKGLNRENPAAAATLRNMDRH